MQVTRYILLVQATESITLDLAAVQRSIGTGTCPTLRAHPDSAPAGRVSRIFHSHREASKGTRGGVAVAMEGYNGYARPLDSLVRSRGYRLYNINNLKAGKSQRVLFLVSSRILL